MSTIHEKERIKNGLWANQKHFILLELENLWNAEKNALKRGDYVEKRRHT
jgi:hypothetical protein